MWGKVRNKGISDSFQFLSKYIEYSITTKYEQTKFILILFAKVRIYLVFSS